MRISSTTLNSQFLSHGQRFGRLNQPGNDICPDVADGFIRGQLLRQAAATHIDNKVSRG